ncbi:hypothetical protein C0J52_24141 [Blattella germanica]|nr:hypothetical protein C0J52_24141 [Blattella germanica]
MENPSNIKKNEPIEKSEKNILEETMSAKNEEQMLRPNTPELLITNTSIEPSDSPHSNESSSEVISVDIAKLSIQNKMAVAAEDENTPPSERCDQMNSPPKRTRSVPRSLSRIKSDIEIIESANKAELSKPQTESAKCPTVSPKRLSFTVAENKGKPEDLYF